MAAAQDGVDNLSAGAIAQSPEQHRTHLQFAAPRNDTCDLPADQGLQQHMTSSNITLESGAENFPAGSERTWLLGLFERMTAEFERGGAED